MPRGPSAHNPSVYENTRAGMAFSVVSEIGNGATAAVPQGINALQVISATPATLGKLIITTAGTTSISFFDNASAASGLVLFTTPASSALGTVYELQVPAANGITCAAQTATTPAMTVVYG